jgi:hypothetical protein
LYDTDKDVSCIVPGSKTQKIQRAEEKRSAGPTAVHHYAFVSCSLFDLTKSAVMSSYWDGKMGGDGSYSWHDRTFWGSNDCEQQRHQDVRHFVEGTSMDKDSGDVLGFKGKKPKVVVGQQIDVQKPMRPPAPDALRGSVSRRFTTTVCAF